MKTFEGNTIITNSKIALICGKWNEDVNKKLIKNAESKLLEVGISSDNICLYRVPGCLEIPRLARKLALECGFDAIICLGVLLDNSIAFQFEAQGIIKELLDISIRTPVPVINSIIMTSSIDEALKLADENGFNYGAMAANAALEVISLEKNYK